MEPNTSGPLSDQPQFTSVELGARTAVLIAEMDRAGIKIRRDEWRFEGGVHIRINYAHREQRIHLMHQAEATASSHKRLLEVVSVNLDSSNWHFPTLEELLLRAKNLITPADAVIHREA